MKLNKKEGLRGNKIVVGSRGREGSLWDSGGDIVRRIKYGKTGEKLRRPGE